jgi:hypothetical protein
MQAEQSIVADPKSPGGISSPHGLILFDGVSVLCSRGCRFVSKPDRRGYFRFVPIHLAEGRPLAEQLGIDPDHPDSFAFLASSQASFQYPRINSRLRSLEGVYSDNHRSAFQALPVTESVALPPVRGKHESTGRPGGPLLEEVDETPAQSAPAFQ